MMHEMAKHVDPRRIMATRRLGEPIQVAIRPLIRAAGQTQVAAPGYHSRPAPRKMMYAMADAQSSQLDSLHAAERSLETGDEAKSERARRDARPAIKPNPPSARSRNSNRFQLRMITKSCAGDVSTLELVAARIPVVMTSCHSPGESAQLADQPSRTCLAHMEANNRSPLVIALSLASFGVIRSRL